MKKIVFSLFVGLSFVACSKKQIMQEPKPIPVHTARALSRDVPYYISTIGHIEAYEIVNVMAQANGQLIKTYFPDGADVKKGELLYLIDQRPYLADLEKAEGALQQNLAALRFAETTAERNAELVKEEYISQNDYDSLITNVAKGDGAVKQSQAALEYAQINLGYTTIYAPIDARAGESKIRDGNLILENGERVLVTLNKITPIYSVFYINEKLLSTVKRYQRESNLKVLVTANDTEPATYEGDLTFVDNAVDISTGMIKLKGTHPNEDRILWPNQYVRVKLILDTLENAVLVPLEAIQTSPNGKYLYIVKGNQTVEKREIAVGQMQEGNTIVITKGVKAGEKVVTVGQLSLYPGAKVSPVQTEENE